MRSSAIQTWDSLILVSLSISTSSMVQPRQLSPADTHLTGNVGMNPTIQSMMKNNAMFAKYQEKQLKQ